ncbi:CoA-disulfide reductase [Spiroplasma sp. BIUS-1]|uniref:CoA-disulfide reductase n=1 Tax=Spiroplasma sp. BIUS-1 TaxID=216964 RepID=UPI00139849AF|nr:CoA-disulfide reductase [Spiroplasma sp. BIUS-1]QHX36511.1 NADH oxidase [Spiroplasma sp. BIUS-1]
MKTLIIGGSATGMGVAARLRRNDPNMEITVIQDKDYVSLGACGLPYFVANNFDNKNNLIARTIEEFKNNEIKVISNSKVKSIDFKSKKAFYNDQFEQYDNLVIAVGAKPIVPNIKGVEADNVFTLTTLEDGVNLKEKMMNDKNINKVAIIGAGFIGLEMSETFSELNKEVYLLEMESKVMIKTFDEEISELLESKLKEKKINTLLGEQLVEIKSKDNKVSSIVLKSGKEIEVDAVLLSVGFQPNTQFLKDSELEMNERGTIIVNFKGETNIENVYSAGDCAVSKSYIDNQDIYSPLATVASKFSKVIADNISGKENEYVGSIQSAILRLFDLEVARTGLTEKMAQDKNIKFKSVFIKDKDHTNYTPNQKDIYLKLIMNSETREIIGAQMAGSNNSVLRIYGLAALIWQKAKVNNSLEQIDLPYAPPFSRSVDIIHIALSKLNK